jgi:DNA-binding NarL/FixJ family response regulator
VSLAISAVWDHRPRRARAPLNDRDVELLRLLASGLSDREIANRLYLSPHTIKHRLDRLRDKLDMRNRIELAAWAGASGYYRATLAGPDAR